MKRFLPGAVIFSLALLGEMEACAQQGTESNAKPPVVFRTQQDHQNMLDRLETTKLRPGRSSNADAPNAANYDEAKANPYPDLPQILKTTTGEAVDTPESWWTQRRPEIVELLESEIYGHIPEGVPNVQWEVRQSREVEAGGKPAIQKAAEESSFGRRTAADLPVDSHMTIALCAPRLTFISHGIPERGDAHWLDHQGSFMAAIAAQPVFRLLGAGDLGRSDDYMKERMPGVNVELLDGALAWRQHDGGHTDGPNFEHFIRWAETQWRADQPEEDTAQDAEDSPDRDARSLKEAVGGRFKLGVGVSHYTVQQPEDADLIRQHFQILTPENCMKPQNVHPGEDEWSFEAADRFVEFARTNRLEVVGHCLVWAKDDRTDQWMMQENGKPVSRVALLRRIETHIHTVVERYADAVTMWDVVNEAIRDSGDGLLRDSVYSRTTGIDFVVTAFKAARAKDPHALLIYNDYNGHKPGKREKLIELLTQLKQKGTPVDAYGMQGHFELGDDSVPQLRETFDALRKLGLKVVVSELDIDVVTRGRWWADGGKHRDELVKYDPYKDGLPAEVEQQQTDQYIELFRLFVENRDIIERVSFWNLHDGQSWLNNFPWRRVNYPLLFDRHRRPKPAFDAVYKILQGQETAHAARAAGG